MLLIKICCSEWKNETRDKRELAVCAELGIETYVIAKGASNSKGEIDNVEGYKVIRYSTRPLGRVVPNSINRLCAIVCWARYVGRLNVDIISGHDLSGLTIGWMSNIFKLKKHRAKLVYDSHEFELGRNCNRSRVALYFVKKWEGFLIRKSAFSIMVNDSIANEVQRIYSLPNKPIVVRNIPKLIQVDKGVCNEMRHNFLNSFSEDVTFILMYHGIVTNKRGIEEIIESISRMHGVGLVILGDCPDVNYKSELVALIEELKVVGRVVFYHAVKQDELWKYVGAADLGCCNNKPGNSKSYFWGLPNKLFENIQSETPVLVSNRPEMRKVVEQYNVGIVCEGEGINDLCECIEKYRKDDALRQNIIRNVAIAKKDLCWEKEKVKLIRAYQDIIV